MNPLCSLWTIITALLLSSLADAGSLSVRLENPPDSGHVILSLYDSANAFGDLRDPVKQQTFPLDGRESFRMEDVPVGEYALLVHIDENGNERIDKNFIGIPKEALGFANGYRPKGPPSYKRALFALPESGAEFDVAVYRPLGRRGRFGAGLAILGRSSPYRDYDGTVTKVIPSLTYNGERLQVYGPNAKLGLAGSGGIRLAMLGAYRFGFYEEEDSEFLSGMGDRDSTFMLGVGVQAELPAGIDLLTSWSHDVLDEIGGGEGRLAIQKSFQLGLFRLSPKAGINWTHEDLAQHDFGVSPAQARPGRPAYSPGKVMSAEVGSGLYLELTRDWLLFANVGLEFLSDDVTDSPIVEKDHVFKGLAAISYVF